MLSHLTILLAASYASTAVAQSVLPSYKAFINPQCYPATPSPLIVTFGLGTPGMSVEKCLDVVSNNGYHFGGLNNGTRCFAGNLIRQPHALPLSACNVPCSLNSAEICGGADTVLIYSNGPPITPTPYTSINGYNWLGCSVDSSLGQSLRHGINAAATIATSDCIRACSGLGFKLAGIKNGFQCFCGNALLNDATLVAHSGGACNLGCEGGPFEECGGSNALTVYRHGTDPITSGPGQTIQSYNGWTLLDCYSDSVSSRSLSNSVNFPKEDMTLEQCLDGCNAQGFKLAGVEYGQECYCGNAIRSPGAVAPSGCDAMQCVGNANQFCGGPDRVLVYQHA